MASLKGTKVKIALWIVKDQSNSKCNTTRGEVISDTIISKVQGYKDQFNKMVDVRMTCGTKLRFNLHELKSI